MEETGEVITQGVGVPAPEDPSAYGLWIPGIPVLIGTALEAVGCVGWLYDLIMDGIVAGVGAVLGFVPQIMILFFLLAILEACGYMARVTFILDRLFRRFGLSGKTFVPMIVGTGCGVPGIMASRTIESESARRLTVMTTTFMPCSAKLPIIALIATAIFGGVWWVAPLAYFMGIAAIIISGIILRKTRPFMGKVTPYVMELPEYRLPRFVDLLRSMWDRAWAFIKKAGTIILLATIVVWFLSGYGIYEGQFMWVGEDLMDYSFLAYFGNAFAWIFAPLGFNNWECASTVITGLIAKENVISTMAVVYGGDPNVAWTSAYMASLRGDDWFRPARAGRGLRLHDLPAALRAVLRGHGRHQARDGWLQQVVLGRHRLGVRICLRDFAHHLPDWRMGRHRCLQSGNHRCHRVCRGAAMGTLPPGQQARRARPCGHGRKGGRIERLTQASGQAFFWAAPLSAPNMSSLSPGSAPYGAFPAFGSLHSCACGRLGDGAVVFLVPGDPLIHRVLADGVFHHARLAIGRFLVHTEGVDEKGAQHAMAHEDVLAVFLACRRKRDFPVALLFDVAHLAKVLGRASDARLRKAERIRNVGGAHRPIAM